MIITNSKKCLNLKNMLSGLVNMSKNTVYVIGAGASKEANLPTGDELKSEISQLLDIRFDFHDQISGDYIITEALRLAVQNLDGNSGNINEYFHAASHIKEALPQSISIDNFIDANRGDNNIELCGKLAIVRSILEAERKSLLYFENRRIDSTLNFTSLQKTWYTPFFKLLTENCSKDDLKERFKTITMIIFNYDRCIEHFIFNALQNYYRISEQEAAELVNSVNIYHPYGDVGDLPWMNQKERMEFGEEPGANRLLGLSQKIKWSIHPENKNIYRKYRSGIK